MANELVLLDPSLPSAGMCLAGRDAVATQAAVNNIEHVYNRLGKS
jgi:hypothetical protein